MDASLNARARVALAVALRDTADLARGLVGDVSTPMVTGELIRKARRVRRDALAVVDRAVLVELANGASWAEVADAVGLDVEDALRVYGDTLEAWLAAEQDALDDGDQGVGLIGDQDLPGTAHSLDQWWRRHADPWDVPAGIEGYPVARSLVDGQASPGDR